MGKTKIGGMSRSFAIGAAAVLAAGLVTGCGGGGQNSGGSKAANGSVTLTWSMWASGTDDRNAWQKVADAVTTADGAAPRPAETPGTRNRHQRPRRSLTI
jgi:hypothetical protein